MAEAAARCDGSRSPAPRRRWCLHALLRHRRDREARHRGRAQRDRRRPAPDHAGVLRGGLAQPVLGAGRHGDSGDGDSVVLDAQKSWVTSAPRRRLPTCGRAAGRTPRARARSGWCRARRADSRCKAPFDGLGLRGNDSSPVRAEGVRVEPRRRCSATDGGGFDIMMGTCCRSSVPQCRRARSGLMEPRCRRPPRTRRRRTSSTYGSTLADLPTVRAYIARMRSQDRRGAHAARRHLAAIEAGRADTMLRVLEVQGGGGRDGAPR